MAKNFVQEGNVVVVEKSGAKSGDLVEVVAGHLYGVAITDADGDDKVTVQLYGVWNFEEDGTSTLSAKGEVSYSSGKVTASAPTDIVIGIVLEDIAKAGTGPVLLVPPYTK